MTTLTFTRPSTISAVQFTPFGNYGATVPVRITLSGGLGSGTVSPNGVDWCWVARDVGVNGATRAVAVPASGTVAFEGLTTLDPATFLAASAALTPAWTGLLATEATTRGAADATLTTAVTTKVDKDSLSISVKDHGATGNGTTDDTAALHAARDLAGVGGQLILPSGTYLTTGLTLNKANQVWELRGGAVILLKAATSANVIVVAAAGVTIKGGAVDGNKANQTIEHSCIATGSANITIDSVEVRNSYGNGISLGTGADGCLIRNNYCHDNGVSTNAGNGIYLTGATLTRVTGNRCENNGTVGNGVLYDGNGIYMAGGAVNAKNVVSNNQSNNNARRGVKIQELGATVTGNSCAGNSGAGIGVTNTPNPTSTPAVISANVLTGNYNGLQMDNCSFISVTGNTMTASTNYGFMANFGANQITVTGNTIVGSGNHGFYLLGGTDWNINGNTALNNGQALNAGQRTGFQFEDYLTSSLDSGISIAITTGVFTTSTPTGVTVGDTIQVTGLTGATGIFINTAYWVRTVLSPTTFTVSNSSAMTSDMSPSSAGTATALYKTTFCRRLNIVGNVSHNTGANTTQDHGFTINGWATKVNLVGNMATNGVTTDYTLANPVSLLTLIGNTGISAIGSGAISNASFYMASGSYIGGTTTGGLTIMSSPTYLLGFWNATPVVQPAAPPANATDLASAIALVNDLKTKLRLIGLMA